MVSISDVSKSFGGRTLFAEASLLVNRRDRIGLVGPNGAGKTTLFSMILGEQEPDKGEITMERNVTVGYLPQESAPAGDETVLQLATAISPDYALGPHTASLGLAYSASSYFYPLKREGPFMMSMQTQRERAQEALNAARKTLRDYVAEGPTEAELTAAKQNIVRGFPLRIDTNRKINEYLALIGVYRLPLTYLDDFVNNVERVTAADVKRAFQKRIDPDGMVTVIVGPGGD